MRRFPGVILGLLFVIEIGAFAAQLATEADLAGTWRVDKATLRGQKVPTSFFTFSLTMDTNGTFVATNVPPDFFFDLGTPAAAEARGTWRLSYDGDGTVHLVLGFTKPESGWKDTFVRCKFTGVPYLSRVSRWYIYMSYHSGKKDSAIFYLTKQE